jgi:hypothetical protein
MILICRFKAMWHITELDIANTIEKICYKALHDHSVTQPVLDLRKKALHILGEAYLSCGIPVEQGLEDIRMRISAQMNAEKDKKANEANDAAWKDTDGDINQPNLYNSNIDSTHDNVDTNLTPEIEINEATSQTMPANNSTSDKDID